ncbi:MAG TPA: 50S ribosomal protein L23 [Planctomycetota bacterium]|nr:50S ribosomal protein L23 [Planctomycetota bacterium]
MTTSPTNTSLQLLDRFYHIIQKPVISEKATDDTANRNAYHFRVPIDANKVEIRQAIEKLFDVKVRSVNTARTHTKVRRRAYSFGTTPMYKRAMVKLAPGNTIDIL